MNGRVAKRWRREFNKRWKTDIDSLLNDLSDLSLKWRFVFCLRVLFRRKVAS